MKCPTCPATMQTTDEDSEVYRCANGHEHDRDVIDRDAHEELRDAATAVTVAFADGDDGDGNDLTDCIARLHAALGD